MIWWVLLAGTLAAAIWVWRLKRRITWTRPSPRRHDLRLAVRDVGAGPQTTVLLHGLAGSGRYFGAEYEALPGRVVIPDLLGFGASRAAKAPGYGVDAHVAALCEVLDALDVESMVVVGHSTGCVLALALARARPAQVERVVAIAPVVYEDPPQARAHLESMGAMVRLFSMPGPLPRRLCRWMCAHRRAAGWLAVLLRPDLPCLIAKDGVQHTWRSYVGTLEGVIIQSASATWLAEIAAPVQLVVGRRDSAMPIEALKVRCSDTATLTTLDGGHDLPLRASAACRAIIRQP